MKRIRILSWNVNGIRAVDKKGALNWFADEKYDILCVQETKAQEEQLSTELRNIDGYQSHFCSAERKGYSGVAVYTRVEPEEVTCGFGDGRFDNEGRVITLHFDKFLLFNVYFPNGKASKERLQYKLDFYDAFLEYVNGFVGKGLNVVICGDVNTAHKPIDLARPEANEKTSGFLPVERAWIDKLIGGGYIDTFRAFNEDPEQYTWWDMKTRARDRNIGWRIDYFFVSDGLRKSLKSAFILQDVMGSDHCPVGIELAV